MERAGLASRLRQERAVSLWPRIAGPELAAHTHALGIREGMLWVAVRNAAWAGQLAFLRTELVDRLAQADAPVKGIFFRVVSAPETEQARQARPHVVKATRPRVEEQEVALLAEPVADERIASAWRGVVRAGLRRSRARAEGGG